MAIDNQKQNPNPNLHEDMIYNILSRLPVKTLLRFRSVCKSWLSLISSTSFIETHLYKSTNDPHHTHHGLVICDWIHYSHIGVHTDPRTCSIYSLFNNDEPHTMICEFNLDYLGVIKINGVVGYCNGLVCLRCIDDGVLYLWNPATRKTRKLPNLEPRNAEYKHLNNYHYGFFYDELNDAFKVYAVYGFYLKYRVTVYSSKSDSWREMGDFPMCDVLASLAIFANGALYWVVHIKSESRILSLDINTEMYQEIVYPEYRQGGDIYGWSLGIFDKSLSLFCEFKEHADLWVLKKCGSEEFWTKLSTIPDTNRLCKYARSRKPICISVNGDIMLQLNAAILLYSSKDNIFKAVLEMDFCNDPRCYKTDVYTCVESLISP